MLTSEGIAIFYGSRLTAGGRGYINELSPSAQQGQLGLQVSGGTTGGVGGGGLCCDSEGWFHSQQIHNQSPKKRSNIPPQGRLLGRCGQKASTCLSSVIFFLKDPVLAKLSEDKIQL